jgi:hypothetical protein
MESKCPNCGYEPEPINFEDALTLKFMQYIAAPLSTDPEKQRAYTARMRELVDNYNPKEK